MLLNLRSRYNVVSEVNAEGLDSPNKSLRYIFCALAQILMIVCLLLLAFSISIPSFDGFVFLSRIGSIFVITSAVMVTVCNRGAVKPGSIIMYAFCAFQYGIPLVIAINPSYSNYVLSSIPPEILIDCSWFSVLCIQSYAFGSIIASANIVKRPRSGKSTSKFMDLAFGDDVLVSKVAFMIFIISGVVAYAYMLWFAALSLESGISYARDVISTNSIRNLARGFFIPSGILFLSFSNNYSKKKYVLLFLGVYGLIGTASGDRTEGMTLLVALLYFYSEIGLGKRVSGSKKFLVVIALVLVAVSLPYIAHNRIGAEYSANSLGQIIEDILGEMGYNFYSICFQSIYLEAYHYGSSYFISLFSMIPDSLLPSSIQSYVDSNLPANWIDSVMVAHYGWATYGQGYSMIAESAYNFGHAGFIVIGIFGYVIQRFIQIPLNRNPKFANYLSTVLLWSFITMPRRGFNEAVNQVSYDVIYIIIIMWVIASIVETRKLNKIKFVDKKVL